MKTHITEGRAQAWPRPINKIPPREIISPSSTLDLSAHYHHALDDDIHHKPANTLSELPHGLRNIDGITFDLRGVIQLASAKSKEITTLDYPSEVWGLPVGQKAHRLHFLHASAWNIESPPAAIADYEMIFEDGTQTKLEIVYRTNIWDWWENPAIDSPLPAWKGGNPRTRERGMGIRLFRLCWMNPKPELTIASLNLRSRMAGPAPMLAGITLE